MKNTFLSFVDGIEYGQLFRVLMLQIAVLAAVTHVAFAVLFYINQVPLLVTVNIAIVVFLYDGIYDDEGQCS